MSNQEHLVRRYMDGFQRSDHPAILACLTDDVVWRIYGVRTTRGKTAFDKEIETPGFEGSTDYSVMTVVSPELTVRSTQPPSSPLPRQFGWLCASLAT